MTKEQIEALDEKFATEIRKKCFTGDREEDHGNADNILEAILLDMGMTETLKAYQEVGKWYA